MTVTEKAIEALRAAIVEGVFQAGNHLTEKAACEYLKISRTPVREALRALAQEGLLSHEPQRHYIIRPVSLKDVAEAYQVRAVLEGLACHTLALKGLRKTTQKRLQECVDLGSELLSGTVDSFDHSKWREMNVRFHNIILEKAENSTLVSAARYAEKVPLATMSVIADWSAEPNFNLLNMAQTDHHYILLSLREGDAARAEARMREHILVAGGLVQERLAHTSQVLRE